MAVCAITNPFCEESKGSRWPDESAAYSLSLPIRYRRYVTVGASGDAAFIFTANAAASSNKAGVVGQSITSITDWTTIPSQISNSSGVRVVSGGIKFVPTQSLMTAEGSATIIEVPPNGDTSQMTSPLLDDYLGLDLTQQNRATYLTVPIRTDHATFAIFRPLGPEARSFNEPVFKLDNADQVNYSTFDWSSLILYIQGATPNSTVGFVDLYLNVEITLESTNSDSVFARPAPPGNPALERASQLVARGPNIHIGNDQSVDEDFMSRAARVLRSGAAAVMDYGLAALEGAATGYANRQYAAGASTPLVRGVQIRQLMDHA